MAFKTQDRCNVAAILKRRKRIIKVGANVNKTHPDFRRQIHNREESKTLVIAGLHAEMNVLRYAQPGDKLEVLRWLANGEPAASLPCYHCRRFICEQDISEVKYLDENQCLQIWKP